jgi:hypothetical protein
LVHFKSFEETLTILAAIVAVAVAYKIFGATLLASSLIGILLAIVVAYCTTSEFTLEDEVITFRNRFRTTSFPVSSVERVGMNTFWLGLPGHTFMFVMRRPPAPVNGYFFRTGLVSWPSASGWVEAVNSSSRSSQSSSK